MASEPRGYLKLPSSRPRHAGVGCYEYYKPVSQPPAILCCDWPEFRKAFTSQRASCWRSPELRNIDFLSASFVSLILANEVQRKSVSPMVEACRSGLFDKNYSKFPGDKHLNHIK